MKKTTKRAWLFEVATLNKARSEVEKRVVLA